MYQEYEEAPKKLRSRIAYLRTPWRETDANIGGGKPTMTADSEERTLEKIEDDSKVIQLRQLIAAGNAAKSHMDDTLLKVYAMRYQSVAKYDWPELPDVMHYERSWIYRRRYAILELLAIELGWES